MAAIDEDSLTPTMILRGRPWGAPAQPVTEQRQLVRLRPLLRINRFCFNCLQHLGLKQSLDSFNGRTRRSRPATSPANFRPGNDQREYVVALMNQDRLFVIPLRPHQRCARSNKTGVQQHSVPMMFCYAMQRLRHLYPRQKRTRRGKPHRAAY